MGQENQVRCKNCGNYFSYSEEVYRLKAEQDESRLLRCPDCRQEHGKIIRELKVPYFPFVENIIELDYNISAGQYTSHGDLASILRKKESNFSGMDLTITDNEILTLYQKLKKNQVVVLVSPTGSGKSTLVPARLLQTPQNYQDDFIEKLLKQGQILITEPRILATQQIPQTISRMTGAQIGPGQLIGYRYSGDDQTDRWNSAVIITDGTLPNWIREGKLSQYSLIMIDEAHERSCNIDLILGFLKRELLKFPQLKLIIASATIDAQNFLNTFTEVGIPVELYDLFFLAQRKKFKHYTHYWQNIEIIEGCDCWLCQKDKKDRFNLWDNQKPILKENDLPEVATHFVLKILSETDDGSILIFLPGEKSIEETVRIIKSRCHWVEVIPAYRRVQKETEIKLKKTLGKRRVIVATNIAETSLTIPDLVYVINSGWIKQKEWNPETQLTKLPSKYHSQDGNRQREGRVGRNQKGYAYALYTLEQFQSFDKHTQPEITRSCLEDVLISIKGMGIKKSLSFPWVEKPQKNPLMLKELARSTTVLSSKKLTTEGGEISENAYELITIPRSISESAFLIAADENGLLAEALTFLWLKSTRDGEARTGANLYNPYLGLLKWNNNWTAKTKSAVYALHQGLRMGCQDDLDFVMKIVFLYQQATYQGVGREWADYYFVNYNNLQRLLYEIDELLANKFGEERVESQRQVNLEQQDKIRLLIINAWPERIINLQQGNPITFKLGEELAAISRFCVGDWSKKSKACWGTITEDEIIINNYPTLIPCVSFLICLPEELQSSQRKYFFIDQQLPVGSLVEVTEEKDKYYINNVVGLPEPIRINYKKVVSDTENDQLVMTDQVSFPNKFSAAYNKLIISFAGQWLSNKISKKARIVEWKIIDSIPTAIISPYNKSAILKLEKKKGETAMILIKKVIRDPYGNGGWIKIIVENDFDYALELSNMSLSPNGPGIEFNESLNFEMLIIDFDNDGFPILTRYYEIIKDLKRLKKLITGGQKETKFSQRKYIEEKGHIYYINEEKNNVIVILIDEHRIIHPFEISSLYIPDGNLKKLKLYEEVVIRIFNRDGLDEIPLEYLEPDEIKTIPKHWYLDREKGKLLVPYCLEDKDFKDWAARIEIVDLIKRHSWQFCLNAQITSFYDRLIKLKPGQMVVGTIKHIEYDDNEPSSNIKSVQIELENDVNGFIFGNDLNPDLPTPKLNQKIQLMVLKVDPNTGYLKLIDKEFYNFKEKQRKEHLINNIERWQANIQKAKETIVKIDANIAKLQTKLSLIYDNDKYERYSKYIDEGQQKIYEIKKSIKEWEEKILSAKEQLADKKI